jgi:putative ABC transport system permease protein
LKHLLSQDLSYALRNYRKRRISTIAILLTLAVGIGLNSILLTVFQALFLAPLPGMRADSRLFWLTVEQASGVRSGASFADYRQIALATGAAIPRIAAFTHAAVSVGGARDAETIGCDFVTSRYFSVLGVRAGAGRLLVGDDDVSPTTGGAPVAVVSARLSRRRFGSETAAIGQIVSIGAAHVTIVGIVADGFAGPVIGVSTDVWMPLSLFGTVDRDVASLLQNSMAGILQLAAIVPDPARRPGIEADATRALQSLDESNPSGAVAGRRVRLFPITRGIQDVNKGTTLPLAIIAVVLSGLVLLVVASNVGGLLMARSLARYREFGIRAALGASRRRLVSQLLTESVFLWMVGGLLGFALAWAVTAVVRAEIDLAPNIVLEPNLSVFGATLVLAFASGMLFGLGPAFSATGADMLNALKDDSGAGSMNRPRLRGAFIIGQLAASLILLAITGQLLRTVDDATKVDPGFEANPNVLAMFFDATAAGIPQAQRTPLYDQIIGRVSHRPGVLVASIANTLPFGARSIAIRTHPIGATTGSIDVRLNSVRPGFFRATGTRLVRGRDFTTADRQGSGLVVIVNETLGRLFWPGRDPIGQRLSFTGDESTSSALTVVGVARDGKYRSLGEGPTPFLYLPSLQQSHEVPGAVLLVRLATPANGEAPALRRELLSLEPRLASTEHHLTLATYMVTQLAPRRRGVMFIAAFGVFALVLTSIGIYGATAQFAASHTRDFGIRLALGAQPLHLKRLVMSEGLRLGGLGVLVGGMGGLILTRGIRVAMLGVSTWNSSTLFLACAVLLGAVALASWLPAHRATRTDPLDAIRHE